MSTPGKDNQPYKGGFADWIQRQTQKVVTRKLLGFEAKKFLIFVAVPIAVFLVFRDEERVGKYGKYFTPAVSSPQERLEHLPKDLLQRYKKGESVEHILQDHHEAMEAKMKRKRERDLLVQKMEKDSSAHQSSSN